MAPPLSEMARLVRAHDRDRFLTTLFAPAERREALLALYAFNYEVAKIRERVSEPLLGRMRLQWWRESLASVYDGTPLRRHEVLDPLAAAIRRHRLTRARFETLLDAREADLAEEPPATLAALTAYAADTSGELIQLALEVLGVAGESAAAAGRHVGIAYAVAGLLRAIPFHARSRRLYLPADLLGQAGVDVSRGLFELKSSPALRVVVAEVAAAGGRHLAAARMIRTAVPAAALPALLPAVLAQRALDRLARVGHDPFDRHLARPDGLQILRLGRAALTRRY